MYLFKGISHVRGNCKTGISRNKYVWDDDLFFNPGYVVRI